MILLSFDIEEFDVPGEHGVDLPLEEQIRVSAEGTSRILDCLQRNEVKATFFCTAQFALQAPEVIRRICHQGHEVASHGYYHSRFSEEDLKRSREMLEGATGCPVRGYRQARMMPVSDAAVREAGYAYNSSLNPTFIPGRYMKLSTPRTYFLKEDVVQMPASVTPLLRFPLFWLSCHHLPPALYYWLCRRTWRADGYLAIYFHPWEFYDLNKHPEWKLPYVVRRHSGDEMLKRLDGLICAMKREGALFGRMGDFVETIIK